MNNIKVPEFIESVPPASSSNDLNDVFADGGAASAGAASAGAGSAGGAAADDEDQIAKEGSEAEEFEETDSNEDNTSDIDRTPSDCDM